jgi:transcriptional repressor NrdR
MKCPVCLSPDTMVMDSRVANEGFAIRRRRQCRRCRFRFSTYEEMEILNLTVIKRDGRREPYSREKLAGGLKRALEKRPYTAENFKMVVNNIETEIQKRKKEEITSQEIGEIVMKVLRKFDKIAYIRFASVYRSFEDVQTFQRELSLLIKKTVKRKKVASTATRRPASTPKRGERGEKK